MRIAQRIRHRARTIIYDGTLQPELLLTLLLGLLALAFWRGGAVLGALTLWVFIGMVYAVSAATSFSGVFHVGIALIHSFYLWRIWATPPRPEAPHGPNH